MDKSLEEKYGLKGKNDVINWIKNIFIQVLHITPATLASNFISPDWGEEIIAEIAEIIELLNHYAIIELDVNGLKSINYFAGHDNGDEFLNRIAMVLVGDAKIHKFINAHKLEVIIARKQGDEFTLLISSQEDLSKQSKRTTTVTRLRELIIEQTQEIDVSGLIDFYSQDVQKKLGKIGCRMLKKAGEKYHFPVSLAGGELTFGTIFKVALNIACGVKSPSNTATNKFKKSLEKIDKYLLDALMSLSLDLTENIMENNKKAFKNYLIRGNDEFRFTSFLMMRNEESRNLLEENTNLRNENARVKKNLTNKGAEILRLKKAIENLKKN
jgi:GGDEF domain-containing protein